MKILYISYKEHHASYHSCFFWIVDSYLLRKERRIFMRMKNSLVRYYFQGLCIGIFVMFIGSLIAPPALSITADGLYAITFAVDMSKKKGVNIINSILLLLTVLISAVLTTLLLKVYCLIGFPSTSCKSGFFSAVLMVNIFWPSFVVLFFVILHFVKISLEKLIARKKI